MQGTIVHQTLEIVGNEDGSATITANLQFSSFEDALEFNGIIAQYLKRAQTAKAKADMMDKQLHIENELHASQQSEDKK